MSAANYWGTQNIQKYENVKRFVIGRNALNNLSSYYDYHTNISGKSYPDEEEFGVVKTKKKLARFIATDKKEGPTDLEEGEDDLLFPSVTTTNPLYGLYQSGLEDDNPNTGLSWQEIYKKFSEESPFAIVDDFRDNDAKVVELISFIRKFLKAPYSSKLSKRIEILFEYSNEDPEEPEISTESLQNFVAFIQAFQNLTYPDVVLSPSGNIVSEWRADPNRHFSAEFLPSGEVRFVIFKPNTFNQERPIRLSGLAPWESLSDIISLHGVFRWAKEE